MELPALRTEPPVIEFYFPEPTAQLYVGRNANPPTRLAPDGTIRDAYAYRLYYDDTRSIICFAKGTLIETDSGLVAVEKLRTNDLIRTRDNGLQLVRWVGSRKLRKHELTAHQNLRPIRIEKGILGAGLPARDLVVSPQHRILIRSHIAQEMFSSHEILIAAKHLLELQGVSVAEDLPEVEYFHILFDQHEIIFANGAETESMYTGAEAMKALSVASREEIFAIFPELQDEDGGKIWTPARPFVSGQMGRQFSERLKTLSLAVAE